LKKYENNYCQVQEPASNSISAVRHYDVFLRRFPISRFDFCSDNHRLADSTKTIQDSCSIICPFWSKCVWLTGSLSRLEIGLFGEIQASTMTFATCSKRLSLMWHLFENILTITQAVKQSCLSARYQLRSCNGLLTWSLAHCPRPDVAADRVHGKDEDSWHAW